MSFLNNFKCVQSKINKADAKPTGHNEKKMRVKLNNELRCFFKPK